MTKDVRRTVAIAVTSATLGALIYASWLSRPHSDPPKAATYGAATYGDGTTYGP